MTSLAKPLIFESVDFKPMINNFSHRTSDISLQQLVVRRGESFDVSLQLSKPFKPDANNPFIITAWTGENATEKLGTKCVFGMPPPKRSADAGKSHWKVAIDKQSDPMKGRVNLEITPPANAPIGLYTVKASYLKEEKELAQPVVLFNAWCKDDSVYLEKFEKKKEYVLNETGKVYVGSASYIHDLDWDFGQFDDDMVEICLKMLDLSHKHLQNPAEDVACRGDPIYVSRIISAMINSEDDRGVLEGRWGGSYDGGMCPTHWSSSHAILHQWFKTDCKPVKYGQCWVFAATMCAVMRLLGIPTRVITNFESAHDVHQNLTIDKCFDPEGNRLNYSGDSIWNFHVWNESWMKRPDLDSKGKYDGWQVLDPTPQELSGGVYCCGPASLKALHSGNLNMNYDHRFVFAEVNADCIDWEIKPDGSKKQIHSDTKRVGQEISTKSVGCDTRRKMNAMYKYKEGSKEEREVFLHASTLDYTSIDGEVNEEPSDDEGEGTTPAPPPDTTPVVTPPPPEVTIKFERMCELMNGRDVNLKMVLRSKSTVARKLSIYIHVLALEHTGAVSNEIQKDVIEKALQPGKELSIPIQVPFSAYNKHMLECETMNVSVLVKDKKEGGESYLAEHNIMLPNPPITLKLLSPAKMNKEAYALMVFQNPVQQALQNCGVTISGSGVVKDEMMFKLPDLPLNCQVAVKFYFVPYKTGDKSLLLDFDCDTFRDIKACCRFRVDK